MLKVVLVTDQILGIPRFERQAQSNVPFAPLRRGLAQLRPAMYMPGLTSGQAPLGGSGFTPESLRTANQGLSPQLIVLIKWMWAVFLLLSYRLLLERPLGSFKPNTINHAQEVCLAQGCLLPEAYLKTLFFKPVLMERQHLRFLHRPQQKQHRHLSQVVQTQTSLVLLVVMVVGIEGDPRQVAQSIPQLVMVLVQNAWLH
jgi:hypothetical protein